MRTTTATIALLVCSAPLMGQGFFGPQRVISTNADGAESVYAADVDGDGDLDVLSASRTDDKIAWYENTDGLGTFGAQQIISTNSDGAFSVYAADVDGDGDLDVLSASSGDDKIAWYEGEACPAPPASVVSTGSSCAELSLSAIGTPLLGNSWVLLADSVETATSPNAIFWLGSAAYATPIPLNATCSAAIVTDLASFLTPAPLGAAALAIPIPAESALQGFELAIQATAGSTDPDAWLGIAVSNAVVGTLGL